MLTLVIISCIAAYLIGSLSSAIIVCKIFKLPDPRITGSMNPGATNVLRMGGKIPAIWTLAGDILKGVLPIVIARLLGIEGYSLGMIAIAVFLGHLYPLFFNFQGGKGVATTAGIILILSPMVGIAAVLIWLLIAIVFGYSSLAALVAALTVPVLMLLFANKAYVLTTLFITAILIWKHHKNIQRLRFGTETKIKL